MEFRSEFIAKMKISGNPEYMQGGSMSVMTAAALIFPVGFGLRLGKVAVDKVRFGKALK